MLDRSFDMNRFGFTAAALAVATATQASAQSAVNNSFNPAISLTLMGQYANYSDQAELDLPGVQLGGEAGLPEEGFSLDHTELSISANIDPSFFGQVTAAIASHDGETELELEEAFVETTALPEGFGLTFGRFLSEVGYSNGQHPHAWDFVDAPLPQQAFLGGNYYDDGVRLSWLAPTPLFLEFGAEALRGGRFPGAAEEGDDIGAYSGFVRVGGDVGTSHSWQLGVSHLSADAVDRTGGGHAHEDETDSHAVAFTGNSDLTVVDAVWKWAPDGNPRSRHLVLQAEYFQRDEDGELSGEAAGELTRYDGKQRGVYAQAVYRFQPRWRVGARYDRLWTDNRADDAELLDEAELADADDAQRYSAMIDYSTSEFSRVRLQYTRSDIAGETGNAWFLQYVMSLGAHGAHRF